MSGEESIDRGIFLTEKQTGETLLGLVDCALPPEVLSFYANTEDHSPDPVFFSPSGDVVVALIDSAEAQEWEDWQDGQDDAPYVFTVLCWDALSGRQLAELHLPYVECLAVLDDAHVLIATTEPVGEWQEDIDDMQWTYALSVWNVRSNSIERRMDLLDRAENLVVSAESAFVAAFFPRTTTIQCWRTADWLPSHAFELEARGGELDSPNTTSLIARRVEALPRERKITSWLGDYRASRFGFVNDHLLVFSSDRRMIEFDLGDQEGRTHTFLNHPVIPWTPLMHQRDDQCEIAVTSIQYAYRFRESQVELSYLVLPTGTHQYSFDTSVQVVRRLPGAVFHPIILDDATILALVEYDTASPWGMAYKTRIGVCNLVSGRVVMLSDHGRLREGDHQLSAQIAPKGDAVAYWVCPSEGPPRLTIQALQVRPLRVEQASLSIELEKSRKHLRAQVLHEE